MNNYNFDYLLKGDAIIEFVNTARDYGDNFVLFIFINLLLKL